MLQYFIRWNSLEEKFDIWSRCCDWLHRWWEHKEFLCGKYSFCYGSVWLIEKFDATSSLCCVPQCNIIYCKLLLDLIQQFEAKDILVKPVICDQGSNNSLLRMLIHSIHEPYFTVKKHKIYCMFDTPHLTKCTRTNVLRKHKLIIGSEIVE